MLCEKILGKLKDFDLTGKTVEYVDIEHLKGFLGRNDLTSVHGQRSGSRNPSG